MATPLETSLTENLDEAFLKQLVELFSVLDDAKDTSLANIIRAIAYGEWIEGCAWGAFLMLMGITFMVLLIMACRHREGQVPGQNLNQAQSAGRGGYLEAVVAALRFVFGLVFNRQRIHLPI
uniref:Uncharacterized protein n=1 Tax=Acrobeloides nanus TaxID=290746 RepID=A0A914C9W8_9BILA